MASSISSIDDVSDNALVHILSFLPTTKKRATTSLVSRRWRHLWKDVPSLHFRLREFPHDDSTYASTVHECLLRFLTGSRPLHRFSADVPVEYNHRTNTYIALLGSSAIRILSTTSLRELSLTAILSVNGRVNYALNQSPQLPPSVLSLAPSLRILKLYHFDLTGIDWAAADTPHRRCFEQLDTLVLYHIQIADEQFRALLAACPFIEKLVISHMYVPINLSSSVNPRLKTVYAHLHRQRMEDAKAVIIDLADLEDLVLCGDVMDGLRMGKSPKLRKVELSPFIAYKMPTDLSAVEIMSATADVFHVEYKEQQDFAFPNLKVLRGYDIAEYRSFVSFLNRCPSLDTLYVYLSYDEEFDKYEDMELEKFGVGSTSPCPVKKITLENVTGDKRDKALIKYLLGKMTCLQCLAMIFSYPSSVMYDKQQLLLDDVRMFARASPVANVVVQTISSSPNFSSIWLHFYRM